MAIRPKEISAVLLITFVALTAQTSFASDLQGDLQTLIANHETTPGLELRRLDIQETRATLGFELPHHINLADLPASFESLYETAVGLIAAKRPEISQIDLLVAHPGQVLRAPPTLKRNKPPGRLNFQDESSFRPLEQFPHGQSLRGRTIAISPGHGWIYNSSLSSYRTQRSRIQWNNCGPCRGIVEDFETHEIVVDYLIPLLEGAGARVVMVRERSHHHYVSQSDDRDPSFKEVNGSFNDGTSEGGHNGGYRFSNDTGAVAEWTLTASNPGDQLLGLWFVQGQNRFSNAKLEIQAPNTLLAFEFNQMSHGRRWTPVHKFTLNAQDTLRVRLQSPAGQSGALIADAVRLGAGKHSSNHPWWEMGAKPFAEYQNAPADIQSIGDVSIRPIYAEWFDADIYVSVHSNASGQADSTAAGTSTYRYNCGQSGSSSDPPASQCDDPVGSDRLQDIVHNSLVSALQDNWDPNWIDRGTKAANFGELRNLDDMPGILLETAFHDNVRLSQSSNLKMTDNQSLHDPRWRSIAAYGIYRGISRYFDDSAALLADPPQALVAKRVAADSVELSFETPPGALSYRVYTACGHPNFDQGQLVASSPALISGLTAETACYFKVAALNAAGEGLASKIVTARPSLRPAQILVVDAFQREDAWVERRDNRHDTARRHGLALSAASHAFDGTTEAALVQGIVRFDDYDGIVLAFGRESTEHDILTPELRQQLQSYQGAIFASGSEIAWTLGARGDTNTQAFLADVFGAAFGNDDAGVLQIQAASNEWLQNISTAFDLNDGTTVGVEARSNDVLLPQNGATIVLTYAGPNTVAAIRKDKNLLLGFALDSVISPDTRATILSTWADQAVVLSAPATPVDAGISVNIDSGNKPSPNLDAGTPNSPAQDAGVTPEPRKRPTLRALENNPIRGGGCGCQSSRPQQKSKDAFSLLLLFGLITLSARRRTSGKDID